MQQKDPGLHYCRGHSIASRVDHQHRRVAFGQSGQRRQGAGEDCARLEAGLAHHALVVGQQLARHGDCKHLQAALRGGHHLIANGRVVGVEGKKFFEAEADHRQGLGGLSGKLVEVQQKDTDGCVGDDQRDLARAQADGFERLAHRCDDYGPPLRVAAYAAGYGGCGGAVDCAIGFDCGQSRDYDLIRQWHSRDSGEHGECVLCARSNHALGAHLAGQSWPRSQRSRYKFHSVLDYLFV